MSFDKGIIPIDSTDIDSTSSSQNLYQQFVAATQQVKEYREKLTQYNVSQQKTPTEDNELLDMVEDVLFDISSFTTGLGNFLYYGEISSTAAEPVKKPVVQPPQDMPNAAELSRLCRERDAAFFKYMDSLELDLPAEIDAFEPNNTPLIPADALTKPYLSSTITLRRQLLDIQNTISTIQKEQRTWVDYIIETFFPAFALKLMSYMTFNDLMAEKLAVQKIKHTKTTQLLTVRDEDFQTQWESVFGSVAIPVDLKSANSTLLSKIIFTFENDPLTNMYTQYNKDKTIANLVKFYRLASQMNYIHQSTEERGKFGLETVLAQLEKLHPNMTQQLQQEKENVQAEMMLLDKYMASSDILSTDNSKPKVTFLKELNDKYRAFLKDRTMENFEALYQHIHDHPQFKRNTLVKETRALLKSQYAEAYQSVRQHYIQHMDEAACEQFITKYELLKYDHVIYSIIMQFMHEPTVEGLLGLKLAMLSITDSDYDQDPKFNEFVADFMEICGKAPISAVNDLRSQRSSVGSFDEARSSETVTTVEYNRSRSSTADSTNGAFTIQALELHNLSYSNSDPRMFGKTNGISRTFDGKEYTPVVAM